MAELSINLQNKTNPDRRLDAQAYKRGDVVWVTEDGYPWNANETSGQFSLIKIPTVRASFFYQLLDREAGDPKVQPLLQRRALRIDYDAYLARVAARIAALPPGQRNDPTRIATARSLDSADAASLTVVIPPLDDTGL